MWRRWATRQEPAPETHAPVEWDSGGYWMEPLRELLRGTARRTWCLTQLQAEALRSVIIGGQWTQARLARARGLRRRCALPTVSCGAGHPCSPSLAMRQR